MRDGKTYHRDIWISHYGNGVLEDNGVSSGSAGPRPRPLPGGGKGLTWAQLYALPTDPAKLEPILRGTPDGVKGARPRRQPAGWTRRSSTRSSVTCSGRAPAAPALREALYDVAANIPGVVVKGNYTDTLGRTGTAVERDGETLVIDPSNGALLADIEGNPNAQETCTPSTTPAKSASACFSGGVGYTYVSQGPATSAP